MTPTKNAQTIEEQTDFIKFFKLLRFKTHRQENEDKLQTGRKYLQIIYKDLYPEYMKKSQS